VRAIDWVRLFREQHVPYVEHGPNIKRGEIGIRCPFCGSADPSHHMGINLENGWWSCWRNRSQHSGKSPLRLIMKLLTVPYGVARELAGLGDDYVDPEGFDAIAARILGRNQAEPKPTMTERRFLRLDPDFMDITERIRTRKFWNYLYQRGFDGKTKDGDDVDLLIKQYGLLAGVRGSWSDRVIVPYFLEKKLVTWTGRAVGPSTMRYRDLPLKDSLMAAKETLYNHDCLLEGGKVLVLQEGPFDALKVDYYGQYYGVRSVGLSTNSVSDSQAFMLKLAEGQFEKIIVMLDTKSELGLVDSMRMKQALSFMDNLSIEPVPFGAGDGGNLSRDQVFQWASQL
jgi:hypothetical protein